MVDTDMVDTVDIFWIVYFPGMNIFSGVNIF